MRQSIKVQSRPHLGPSINYVPRGRGGGQVSHTFSLRINYMQKGGRGSV